MQLLLFLQLFTFCFSSHGKVMICADEFVCFFGLCRFVRIRIASQESQPFNSAILCRSCLACGGAGSSRGKKEGEPARRLGPVLCS